MDSRYFQSAVLPRCHSNWEKMIQNPAETKLVRITADRNSNAARREIKIHSPEVTPTTSDKGISTFKRISQK